MSRSKSTELFYFENFYTRLALMARIELVQGFVDSPYQTSEDRREFWNEQVLSMKNALVKLEKQAESAKVETV